MSRTGHRQLTQYNRTDGDDILWMEGVWLQPSALNPSNNKTPAKMQISMITEIVL